MGFLKGLEAGWHEFKREFEEASETVGRNLGRGFPWLIVVAVIIAIAVLWAASCGDARHMFRSQVVPPTTQPPEPVVNPQPVPQPVVRPQPVTTLQPLTRPQMARALVGTWDGTIAGYRSTVTFSELGSGVSVVGSMEKANRPTEDWQITDIADRQLTIYRPDDDAQLSVSLQEHSTSPCLIGQYLEPGSSRPISLCRRSS
jgi:hypothetical protein